MGTITGTLDVADGEATTDIKQGIKGVSFVMFFLCHDEKCSLSFLCLSLGWRGLVEHVDLVFKLLL